METTAVSLGKAVLDGVLGYVKSMAAEEIALQFGVEHDVSFITDELEMMQSLLKMADDDEEWERKHNQVRTTWVKQVRDLAYNVEDNLVDFTIHVDLEKPNCLWCIPRNPSSRRRIAMEVKELRAKVEDVSSRNNRYRLIKEKDGASSLSLGEAGPAGATSVAAMFGFSIDEATRRAAMEHEKPKEDLAQLILSENEEMGLSVVAVWGTCDDLGKMSEIRKVYEKAKLRFRCRAWVRVMHPFDPRRFIESLVRQFYTNSSQVQENSVAQQVVGAGVLLEMEKMGHTDLIHVFEAHVSRNRYLIVINDLSTIEEWDCIKTYFPDKKNRSRIIVATQQVEIASLCTEQPHQVSELKQLSAHQILYLFHKKVERPETDSPTIPESTANASASGSSSTMSTTDEIQETRNAVPTVARKLDRIRTRAVLFPEDIVLGRTKEESEVIDLLVGHPHDDDHGYKVISVWGMGGIGKTTLVRRIYRSQQLGGWKRAWATALRPFNRDALLRNLALQLQKDIQQDSVAGAGRETHKKNIETMGYQELASELSRLLHEQRCLIILDDLSSTEEWDSIKPHLAEARRIIATTREKVIAKHCSEDDRNMYNLGGLDDDVALKLFKNKVFKEAANVDLSSGMLDQAKLILKKCDGLPLAISTIGGYLANKPKTSVEWRKLNHGLSAELEINPSLKMIKTVLMRSYDGLPYHLKASFLYLSIFPEDHIIQRKHVVARWIAEGFSRDTQHMTAKHVGDKNFDELLDRSMTLPSGGGTHGSTDSCQLHDLIREICISKAREESFVFTLEEGCSVSSAQGAIRHLSISSNWKRDKDVMQRMLDLSHLRSLTVFGEWRSFFLSKKMRFLRVLDLSWTTGLRDHHLDRIGELLHLRYLSLRGCAAIVELPNSFGNLRQLQTLDIRNTWIMTLPTAVTKLQKLQYLHAFPFDDLPTRREDDIFTKYSDLVTHDDKTCVCCSLEIDHCTCCVLLLRNTKYVKRVRYWLSMAVCLSWRPHHLDAGLGRSGPHLLEDGVNRHDLISLHRYLIKREEGDGLRGVKVPTGISKLKALQTLRVINVAREKTALQELRELTQLRKLGVVDCGGRNNKKFWHAIAGHNRLRSLSVSVWDGYLEPDVDFGLGPNMWPPESLESLRLCGHLSKVTEWVHRLQNLTKLQLEYSRLNSQDGLQALGTLPNLAVLRLKNGSFECEQLLFHGLSFLSLLVLELELHAFGFCNPKFVEFEQAAAPKLEVLLANGCTLVEGFPGLHFLKSLKEVQMDRYGPIEIVHNQLEIVQNQLAKHPKNVIFKVL